MTEDLERIVELTRAREEAEYRAWRAQQDWASAIRWAVYQGASPTKVAASAKISRARVYQIRDGKR